MDGPPHHFVDGPDAQSRLKELQSEYLPWTTVLSLPEHLLVCE